LYIVGVLEDKIFRGAIYAIEIDGGKRLGFYP
jgi:hypothetical protein